MAKRGFTIHHNGPPANCVGKPHTRCVAFWESVRRYHMVDKGWSNIAYSFGVCPHGTRFVGGGWDGRQFANGSDDVGGDEGPDSEWYTVLEFIGWDDKTGIEEQPTPEMVTGTAALIAEGRSSRRCGTRVTPHNFWKQKRCPGLVFTALAKAWDNAPLTITPPQEEDMPLDANDLNEIEARVRTAVDNRFATAGSDTRKGVHDILQKVNVPGDPYYAAFQAAVKTAVGTVDVDEAAIATAVAAAVIEALPAEVTDQVTVEEVEQAVVAGLGSVKFVPDVA